MKKLALNVDDLDVQSFDTTPALQERCTVLAHQENGTYEWGCTDACSLYTCASCEPCDQTLGDPADTVDEGRRIILY